MTRRYIYLLRMADGVYKVGRTAQGFGMNIQRFKSYPADSIVCLVLRYTGNVVVLEAMILAKFRERFNKHERGLEYFTGSEDEMISTIYESFVYTRDKDKQNVEAEVDIYLEKFECKEPRQLQKIIWEIESPFSNKNDFVDKKYLVARLQELGFVVTDEEIVYNPQPKPETV